MNTMIKNNSIGTTQLRVSEEKSGQAFKTEIHRQKLKLMYGGMLLTGMHTSIYLSCTPQDHLTRDRTTHNKVQAPSIISQENSPVDMPTSQSAGGKSPVEISFPQICLGSFQDIKNNQRTI